MVKITAVLPVAMVASLCSAEAFFLTTQQSTINGKQNSVQNQLLVFDNNNITPCSNSAYQSYCGVAPKYDDGKTTTCSASYNGTKPYADTVGIFTNGNGIYVSDGYVGADNKNNTVNFVARVTTDSRCKPFSCNVKANGGNFVVTWQGFRCII